MRQYLILNLLWPCILPYSGGVRDEDYGGRELLQRTAAGSGRVRGVRRKAGGRLPVESSDDSTWESSGAKTPVDHPGRGQGPPGITDVLSSKGGTAEMPRGGVPGENGDKDGDAGALCGPECPRHRGDYGGRKLPPPTVRQVQHAGTTEGAEWASPRDRTVYERSGEEDTADGRDGDEGALGAGF